MSNNEVVLGKVVSAHGVKGFFKILIYSNNEQEFFLNKNFFHIDNKKIDIKKKFTKGNFLICESTDIKSRSDVSRILNKHIVVYAKDLKKNNREYFHKDLVGCLVINDKFEELGIVKSIHNFGAGDILELDSKYPFMIRFEEIEEKNINTKKKIIIINPEFH